jgi:TrmH family RNA methyltransferase
MRELECIASRQNSLVKRVRELVRKSDAAVVLLDGEHLLEEALASGVRVEVAAFADRVPVDRLVALAAAARQQGARTVRITNEVLSAMSPVRKPSGVIAIAHRAPASIGDVLARAPQLVLLLDRIQDAGNVGAIIRAAEGCGATGVVCGEGTADPFGWKALRGSMGSIFRVPVVSGLTLALAAQTARDRGIRLMAAIARGGTSLPDCDFRGPTAVMLGSEGRGLSDDLIRAADERLTIPMRPPVESLNVAIAAALILYEASRQRQEPTGEPRQA